MGFALTHKAIHTIGLEWHERSVLILLADYANDSTGVCWPSQETLANLWGRSRKRVNEVIDILCAKGYVVKLGMERHRCKYKVFPSAKELPRDNCNMGVTVNCNAHVTHKCNVGVTSNCNAHVTQTYKGNKEGEHIIQPSLDALIGPIPSTPAERRAWAVKLVDHCFPVWQSWKPIVRSMTATLPPHEAKEIEAICEEEWARLAAKDSAARLPALTSMAM